MENQKFSLKDLKLLSDCQFLEDHKASDFVIFKTAIPFKINNQKN